MVVRVMRSADEKFTQPLRVHLDVEMIDHTGEGHDGQLHKNHDDMHWKKQYSDHQRQR